LHKLLYDSGDKAGAKGATAMGDRHGNRRDVRKAGCPLSPRLIQLDAAQYDDALRTLDCEDQTMRSSGLYADFARRRARGSRQIAEARAAYQVRSPSSTRRPRTISTCRSSRMRWVGPMAPADARGGNCRGQATVGSDDGARQGRSSSALTFRFTGGSRPRNAGDACGTPPSNDRNGFFRRGARACRAHRELSAESRSRSACLAGCSTLSSWIPQIPAPSFGWLFRAARRFRLCPNTRPR
jgi:hypothetical protein